MSSVDMRASVAAATSLSLGARTRVVACAEPVCQQAEYPCGGDRKNQDGDQRLDEETRRRTSFGVAGSAAPRESRLPPHAHRPSWRMVQQSAVRDQPAGTESVAFAPVWSIEYMNDAMPLAASPLAV